MIRAGQGILALPALYALAACGHGPTLQPPLIEARFARIVPPSGDTVPKIQIAVSTGPVADTDGGISITQLSDRGQAALINQTKGAPPITLEGGGDDSGSSRITVHAKVQRQIVVALRPDDFLSPGDRVDAIKVTLSVAPSQQDQWAFSSWSQATNGQSVITVGSISNVAGDKLTAGIGIGAPTGPNATLGAEADRSSTQTQDIKDTTDFDAAVDEHGAAWLDETAGWRVNLSHNLSVTATLTAPAQTLVSTSLITLSKLSKTDAKTGLARPVAPKDVQISLLADYAPQGRDKPICGVARLSYRIRHVENPDGQRTFTESDDDVSFRTGTSQTSFTLAPPPYAPHFGVHSGEHLVSYKIGGRDPAGLEFASLSEAAGFVDWLGLVRVPVAQLQNAAIGIVTSDLKDLRPLTASEIAALKAGVLDETNASTALKTQLCAVGGA